MLAITFAALCMAVISAQSSPVSSYSSGPSSMRDYEYTGDSYLGGKHSYSDLSNAAYITGGSPYAKSDTRYSADSGTDSSEPRASLTSSFYKSKYGSEAVVNAIRPSPFHTSSSSSSSSSSPSSSSSSSELSSNQASGHYSSSEYPSGSSSSSSGSSPYYENNAGTSGTSGSSPSEYSASASYSTGYGDRSPVYSGSTGEGNSAGAHSEYTSGRPAGLVYGGYSGNPSLSEYTQGRPTTYSHGSIGSPVSSHLSSSSDYMLSGAGSHAHPSHPPQQQHHASSYQLSENYPPHAIQAQPSHGYKTYVTSSPSYPSKTYQSVFGALKSLFGGGGGPMLSDAAPSATHLSTYPAGPAYSSGMMHHASPHHGPAPSAMGSAGPSYYFGSGGAGSSGSPFSKSYPPMRIMSGYGGSGNNGGKIIVVRDSSNAHGSPYASSAGALLGSPSSYVAKSKISGFSPSHPAPSYLTASPSSLSYSGNGPPSSAYPSSYSSSGSFSGGHGGSTFLGYSA